MRDTYTRLYIHFIWATWDRLPLLTEPVKELAYACIWKECEARKATVIALGGIEDHVHLLAHVPITTDLPALVQRMKGVSSRVINQEARPETPFKWQGSYSAFSVSSWDVPKIKGYIHNQEEYHRNGTTKPILERINLDGEHFRDRQ